MLSTIALSAFGLAASAWLLAAGLREHRAALAARARLLDGVTHAVIDPELTVGPDGFPRLTGRLPDRRHVTVELLPDTMVVRRLPQLWLVVTIRERLEVRRPSLGALARSTGAEFYAWTHELPDLVDHPLAMQSSLLVRAAGPLRAADRERGCAALAEIFADPLIKEAVATPRAVRVVRQAAEGERGAHLLLRQARFHGGPVERDGLRRALAAADVLGQALAPPRPAAEKLSA